MRAPGMVALFVWGYLVAAAPAAAAPPLDKVDFIRNYQGNFGGIKVPGCGFYNDSLSIWCRCSSRGRTIGPVFEKAMQAHAIRGDNRVVVDPRADYHGGQGGRSISGTTRRCSRDFSRMSGRT